MRKLLSKSDAEKAGLFYKTLLFDDPDARVKCIARDINIRKSQSEGVDSIGGYLTPELAMTPSTAVFEGVGVARSDCEFQAVQATSVIRARRVQNATAFRVAEGSVIPETSVQVAGIQASPYKVACLLRFSSEVASDSDEDVGELITRSVNYSFRLQEDTDCFNADGTSTYSGATGLGKALSGKFSAISAASGHHSADLIDSSDIGKTMSSILGSALGGAKFYTNPAGFGLFARLSAVSGGMLGTTNPDGTVLLLISVSRFKSQLHSVHRLHLIM
jgi:HK97 family phage major capsid protein